MSDTQQAPAIQLNGPAPDFTAKTTAGDLTLSEWEKDKWVVLFSHPADFTPVCTTEFVEFARRQDDFTKRNVALLGNSVDSVHAHIAWLRSIEHHFGVKVKFPVIADLDQKVSQKYGMIHEPSSVTAPVRAVYFIDPKRTIRAMIYYPLNVGRNFDEILRVVDALQTADQTGLACPADWAPGKPLISPPPATSDAAEARLGDTSLNVKDWYLAFTKE